MPGAKGFRKPMDNIFNGSMICFIVGTLCQGGAERQLFYMLRTLREQGNTPTVLCLKQGEFWEPRIRDLGIQVIWVGQHESQFLRLLKIINEVRRLKPDILQSSHFYTNLYAVFAGFFTGIPSIGAIRNDCISECRKEGRIMGKISLGKLSLKAPRLIAANSLAGIRAAISLGVNERRLLFLPNVVDVSAFPMSSKASRQPMTIVAAGRLVEQKRMDRFIRLVALLHEQTHGAIKGLIVGDGPLREALEHQAKGLGLTEETFEFRGLVTDMVGVYRESDIFVLTSDWEGTPNVVLEAMASGLPVVSTNVGGVSDIIENGKSGFVVDANDEGQILDLLLRLIENPILRESIAQHARFEVEKRFALHLLPSYLESLYTSALM
jgi:glycosyltransferase involved in cell wall biosynthesis